MIATFSQLPIYSAHDLTWSDGWQPHPADEGAFSMIHPLQLASAVLVALFATALYAGTKSLHRPQLESYRPQLAVQVAAMPIW
jgi:hypothetical protein